MSMEEHAHRTATWTNYSVSMVPPGAGQCTIRVIWPWKYRFILYLDCLHAKESSWWHHSLLISGTTGVALSTTVAPGSSSTGRLTSWQESSLSGNKMAKMSFTLLFFYKSITVYFPVLVSPHPLRIASLFLPEATTSTGVHRTTVVGRKTGEN